jgi:hypothetical protein
MQEPSKTRQCRWFSSAFQDYIQIHYDLDDLQIWVRLTEGGAAFILCTEFWIPVAAGRMVLRLKMLTSICMSFSPSPSPHSSPPLSPRHVFIGITAKLHCFRGQHTVWYLQRILLHFHKLFTWCWCFWRGFLVGVGGGGCFCITALPKLVLNFLIVMYVGLRWSSG